MPVQPADPYELPEEREARLLREQAAKKAVPGGAVSGGLGGALGGAGTGATIGSVIPGIGTAIGAGIGALAGGIGGAVKGGQDAKAKAAAQPQQPAQTMVKPALTPARAPGAAYPGSIMAATPPAEGSPAATPPQAMVGRVRPGQEQMAVPAPMAARVTPQMPPPPAAPAFTPTPGNSLLAGLGKTFKQNPVGAIGAGLDVAQTIGDFAQNASEKRNAEQIRSLEGKEAAGIGLEGRDRARMEANLVNPVRTSTTQLGNSLSAANGQVSPAQLASMRRDAGATIAGAEQDAISRVDYADAEERKGNRAELEQRIATRGAGQEDNRAALAGRIGQAVTAESEKAAEVPLDIYGPYGEPIKDTGQAKRALGSIGYSPQEQDEMVKAEASNPGFLQWLFEQNQDQAQPMGG